MKKSLPITFFSLVFIVFSLYHFLYANTNKSNTLTIAWPVNAGSLNPHLYNPNQMYAQTLVYDSLVRFNGSSIEPALAESWSISEDGLTYTFKIRKARFSDGQELSAQDILLNFQAILENRLRHGWLTLVNLIEEVSVYDKTTFILKLKKPYNFTLEELSLSRPFRILSPNGFLDNEINTSKGIKSPIGTGPWKLIQSKLGEYDIFERNDFYWGEKPNFKYIKVLVLPDPNSRIIALETGKIDLLIGEGIFSVENFVRLSKNSNKNNITALKSSPRLTNMIAINTNKNNLKDKNVRQAIQYAINKDNIINYILLNQEERADQIYNPSYEYCNIGLTAYEYNIKKANELLDNGGWIKNGVYREKDGSLLSINLHYIGIDPKQKAIGEVIQANLMEVGIKLNLIAEESTIFYSLQLNGNFDMIFNKTWGPPLDPGTFTASMLTPTHADYQAQLGLSEKKDIDSAINQLLLTDNKTQIKENYKYILETLHDNGVYLPISFEPNFVLYNNKRVKNFTFGGLVTEFMFHKLELVND